MLRACYFTPNSKPYKQLAALLNTQEWLFCSSLITLMTHSILYRNQSIDLQSKSMDWFLYDSGLRHKSVKKQRYSDASINMFKVYKQ